MQPRVRLSAAIDLFKNFDIAGKKHDEMNPGKEIRDSIERLSVCGPFHQAPPDGNNDEERLRFIRSLVSDMNLVSELRNSLPDIILELESSRSLIKALELSGLYYGDCPGVWDALDRHKRITGDHNLRPSN